MAHLTLSSMRQKVIRKIGEVSGTGVQEFSEDNIDDYIQEIFNFLFKKRFWPHLTEWGSFVLNGSTGVSTSDLGGDGGVELWSDFRVLLRENEDKPIPILPSGINPNRLTGTNAAYFEPLPISHANYEERLVRILPITAAGTIEFHARRRPTNFADNDEIPFDEDTIILGASWLYADSEDINPGAATTLKEMFNNTYEDLVAMEGDAATESPYGQVHASILTDWT